MYFFSMHLAGVLSDLRRTENVTLKKPHATHWSVSGVMRASPSQTQTAISETQQQGKWLHKKQHRGPRVLEKATNTAAGKHHLDIRRRCVVFLLHTNDLTGFQQGCYNDPTHIVVLNCNGK